MDPQDVSTVHIATREKARAGKIRASMFITGRYIVQAYRAYQQGNLIKAQQLLDAASYYLPRGHFGLNQTLYIAWQVLHNQYRATLGFKPFPIKR